MLIHFWLDLNDPQWAQMQTMGDKTVGSDQWPVRASNTVSGVVGDFSQTTVLEEEII